jgi:hypothetical protein
MIRVLVTQVRPDKVKDYFELAKNESKRRLWAVSTAHFSFGMLFVGMA